MDQAIIENNTEITLKKIAKIFQTKVILNCFNFYVVGTEFNLIIWNKCKKKVTTDAWCLLVS
jgi:hypothetical protein